MAQLGTAHTWRDSHENAFHFIQRTFYNSNKFEKQLNAMRAIKYREGGNNNSGKSNVWSNCWSGTLAGGAGIYR